jgi:uncharacterized protein
MIAMISAALASGALVGFSLGLIGGGGSMLATPLLLYVVGVAQPRWNTSRSGRTSSNVHPV